MKLILTFVANLLMAVSAMPAFAEEVEPLFNSGKFVTCEKSEQVVAYFKLRILEKMSIANAVAQINGANSPTACTVHETKNLQAAVDYRQLSYLEKPVLIGDAWFWVREYEFRNPPGTIRWTMGCASPQGVCRDYKVPVANKP